MGSEWEEVKLSDVAERIGDGLHGTPIYTENGDYPFINGNNLESGRIKLKDNTKLVSFDEYIKHKKDISENAVLVSINGTIGNVALYNGEDVLLGKSACYINLKKSVSKYFIQYVLSGSIFQEYIKRYSTGSTIKNVSLKMMRDFDFKIPKDLEEQEQIILPIYTLDKKIELNRQINQTLEQMAQALFKSWFVDFDPVIDNALDAGNPIPEALAERAARRQVARASDGFQTIPADVRQLFPSEFEESELGWIPKGWEETKLNDLIEIKHGFAFKGEHFSDSETSDVLLTPGNVKIGGGFKPDKYKFYSGPIVNDYVFKVGEMFVNMTDLSKASDTLGYPAIVPDYKGLTFHHNQRLGKVIYSDHACSKKEFIYQILCSKSYRDEVLGSSTGTTVKHTSPKKILNHSVICTKLGQIEQIFDSKVSYFMKKLNENESNSRVLTKLRDTLLPKLISGELRLDSPEVEQAKSLLDDE